MNYVAQNANCTGYNALSNVAFAADSFSVTSTPTSGSPVTLQATGVTASGATTTLTRSNVPVYRTTPYTFTLQPATLLRDSHIRSDQATRNFGGENKLRVDGNGRRPLLYFDLSSIPATARVQSAQLMLYKSGGAGGSGGSTITAYPLTRTWVEGTLVGENIPADGVTWNTTNGTTAWTAPGGDYDASAGVAIASTGSNDVWLSWDISSLVGNWVSGATANHGVILIPSATVPGQDYVSGDDTAQRDKTPKLIVTFQARCDWTPPASSATFVAGADSYIDKNAPTVNYGGSTSITLADKIDIRGTFQFDVSSVVPGTLVTSALLRLYVTSIDTRSGGTMNIDVHRLTSAWTEGAVTWQARTSSANWGSAGGDFPGKTMTLNLPPSFNSGWIEFDITSLAQGWVDGIIANNGVIVREKADDRLFVAGKEAGTATAPQLVLSY
jgi:hypothetical protein